MIIIEEKKMTNEDKRLYMGNHGFTLLYLKSCLEKVVGE